jgi:hypothetical protein
MLREVHRILTPDGIVAVHAPVSYAKLTPDRPLSRIEVPPYHIYEFPRIPWARCLRRPASPSRKRRWTGFPIRHGEAHRGQHRADVYLRK